MKEAENVQDQESEGRRVRKPAVFVVAGHQGDHRLVKQGSWDDREKAE